MYFITYLHPFVRFSTKPAQQLFFLLLSATVVTKSSPNFEKKIIYSSTVLSLPAAKHFVDIESAKHITQELWFLM